MYVGSCKKSKFNSFRFAFYKTPFCSRQNHHNIVKVSVGKVIEESCYVFFEILEIYFLEYNVNWRKILDKISCVHNSNLLWINLFLSETGECGIWKEGQAVYMTCFSENDSKKEYKEKRIQIAMENNRKSIVFWGTEKLEGKIEIVFQRRTFSGKEICGWKVS